MRIVEVDKNSENQRFDKFLMKYFNIAGKSFIYKMLRKKNIKLNNSKAIGNEILKSGDTIQMYLAEDTINSFMEIKAIEKADDNFSIIYEDENIIICNKPSGVAVQKNSNNKSNTLNDKLLYYLYKKGEYIPEKESVFTPSICNRLDINTSGIVLFGKNLKAVQSLNDIIKNRCIDKFYITILNGVVDEKGVIEAYLMKDEKNNTVKIFDDFKTGSKKIITKYKKIADNGKYSLAEIDLITGKTHQIRASFKHIGYSIIGDKKYGKQQINDFMKNKYGLNEQFLHAYKVVFNKNCGFFSYLEGKEFVAPLDEKKESIVNDLFKRWFCFENT